MKDKKVGIIGINGMFGKCFGSLLHANGCEIIGSDIKTACSNREVVERSEVVIFAVSLKAMVSVIESVIPYSRKDQLWIDIGSKKTVIVRAMLRSKAEVLGIHPLFGPSSIRLWREGTIVACPVRLKKFLPWAEEFLRLTTATIVYAEPEEHDYMMLAEQNIQHVATLALARALVRLKYNPAELIKFSTALSKQQLGLIARMLGQSPDTYCEIQLGDSQRSVEVIDALMNSLGVIREIVRKGNREAFMKFFGELKAYYGDEFLKKASRFFV